MEKFFNLSLYKRLITGVLFLFIFFFSFFKSPVYFSFLIFFILLIILFFEWPKLMNPHSFKFWLVTPIYPILSFILIILLNTEQYRILLFNMFILVFAFDTGSYIIGKLFGKHKLCPNISPGKTWEGFFGGYLFVCLIFFILFSPSKSYISIFLFSFILSLLALFGDLFESTLKRKVRIKDSGNFLPGHGGFLDRFDSIMFVVIFFYLFKDYLIKFFYL